MNLLFFLLFIIYTTPLIAQNNFSQYTLTELDSIYKAESNPKKKLHYTSAMLERTKKEFGATDTAYAKVLTKVGTVYVDINLDSAIVYIKKAIDIQKIKIPKHTDYANSLNNLGTAYYYLGNLKEVEKYWSQSALLRKEVLGKKHLHYIGSLINLGNLYMELAQYTKAADNYSQAKNIFETQNLTTHNFYINCLSNLGVLHENIREYEKAEGFYLQSLAIQKATLGEQHPTYLVTLGYLASIYKLMGEYSKSESFLLQVLKLKKEILGKSHYSYTETLNSLGNLYIRLKDYEKAESFYLQDLDVIRKVSGEKNISYAHSLGSLGFLYRKKNDYEKSESVLLQSLKLKKEALGTKHPTYASALNNLADLYNDMKEYAKAEPLYLEAYYIRKETLGEKHNDLISNLNSLASIYRNMNQLDLVWQYALLAILSNTDLAMSRNITPAWIDSLEKADLVSLESMDYSLFMLYEVLGKQGLKEQQILICDIALKLLKRQKDALDAEEDRLVILTENAKWVLRSMRVLDKNKDAAKAFNIAEQNKSVLLLEAASNKRVHSTGILPDSIIQQEKNLQNQYAALKAALAEKRPDNQRDSLRNVFMDLNFNIDNFQKKIKKDYPKYATIKYQHEAIQAKEIQATLGANTAMLEYLIGDSLLYIFYIDKTQIKVHELAIPHTDLNNRIDALHDALSNYAVLTDKDLAYRKYTAQAYWFYEHLIAPTLSNAKGLKQLIIVTDGELGHLPFEAFLVEQAPQTVTDYKKLHYLIKDYQISYNYSATLFADAMHSKHTRKNNHQILGMAANYGIQLDSSKSLLRLPADARSRETLAPLPAARAEVEALQAGFQGFFAFDNLASEKVFKQKAANFSVIHLALHGLLNKQEQALSSLAFTEDGDSLENNFLHAYEISSMELNADLVILSACETGYGKFERGNGIASLARSFMYAGIPAMIVSLWQVNDHSTAYIMQNLYDNLAAGMPKDEALRQAKLLYIQVAKGIVAHPAFWSPFIMIGNTDPTVISKKKGGMFWAIGGLAIFVLGGLGIAWRRKE